MLRRYLKLNQGMTMGMVLIIMSVLSILGIAILSLSVSAYRVQISDRNVKTTFYVADSTLDQTYSLIGKQIKKAIEAGNQAVNKEVQKEIEKEKIYNFQHPDKPVYKWLKSDGTLNEDYLREQLKIPDIPDIPDFIKIMQTAYVDNLNEYYDPTKYSDDDELYSPADYTAISGDVPESVRIDGKIIPFDVVDLPGTRMTIPLIFKVKNESTQVIQQVKAKLNISVPQKILGYQSVSNTVNLQDQPLWRTALVSYQNIDLAGPSINVKGDIFAAGTIPQDPQKLKNLSLFGGITAGKSAADPVDGTEVRIAGNAYSYANVQVNSNNTALYVQKSVYSDNIVIQSGTVDSRIEIGEIGENGKVDEYAYTKDDIEINGIKSILLIKGHYNGYSGGEAGHDQSSSIVINSPDINVNNGSKVRIVGDSFLAGVVYINSNDQDDSNDPNDPNDPNYQTGESVSVNDNYRAYGYLPEGDENKYTFRKVGKSLILIDQLKETLNYLNIFDKAEHFYKVYKNTTDFLNTGYGTGDDDSSISLGGNVFSLGGYISNGEIYYNGEPVEDYGDKQNKCREKVEEKVNNQFAAVLADRVKLSEISEIAKTADFPEFKGLVISEHDVALIGADGDSAGLPIGTIVIDASSDVGGLILTTGQVYVRGKVNYYGSIIAGGNITVEDDYPKHFYASENLVKQIIAENDLNSLFIPPTLKTISFVYDVSGKAPEDPGTNPYADLISVTNWKKL
ncbi:MAG TPA: hypothetical protein VN370_10030 [Desulfitobacteriaceae bacterium]|nr:hypothetical protein [Desulfitobacteriaceae bacterium]